MKPLMVRCCCGMLCQCHECCWFLCCHRFLFWAWRKLMLSWKIEWFVKNFWLISQSFNLVFLRSLNSCFSILMFHYSMFLALPFHVPMLFVSIFLVLCFTQCFLLNRFMFQCYSFQRFLLQCFLFQCFLFQSFWLFSLIFLFSIKYFFSFSCLIIDDVSPIFFLIVCHL